MFTLLACVAGSALVGGGIYAARKVGAARSPRPEGEKAKPGGGKMWAALSIFRCLGWW